ncbi:MAG: lysophospholipase [Planctomycetes bacterium]|nr:lysophospholipase [Planctomycetota bacterium]
MTRGVERGVPRQFQIRSRDGTALNVYRLPAEGTPRARVAIVHGFAEHGGRYTHVQRYLAERGFESFVLDLRGHGRSSGARTYVRAFSDYTDDEEVYLREVLGGSRLPAFALGHSMGALVLARTLQAKEGLPRLDGVVLSSPFFGLGMKLPLWKTLAGKTLSRVIPGFRLPSDLDPAVLSRDPEVGRAYLADPLVVKSATSRWFTATLGAHKAVLKDAGKITLPVLMQHGDADTLASLEAAQRVYARLGGPKQFKLWSDMRHELFNELDQLAVLDHLHEWFADRMRGE